MAKENKEKEYISEIKAFFNSEAWKEYAQPLIYRSVQSELPKPNKKGWQEKYIYAHALSTALSLVINTLSNLSGKQEYLKKVEKYINSAIDET